MFRLWLLHLNRKYDNIDEPWRLLLLIALAMPGIILTAAETPLPFFIGAGYLIILTLVRLLYLHGKL